MFESQVCVEHYWRTVRALAIHVDLLSVVCRCKICSVNVLVYVHHEIYGTEWGPVYADAEKLMMAVNWEVWGRIVRVMTSPKHGTVRSLALDTCTKTDVRWTSSLNEP